MPYTYLTDTGEATETPTNNRTLIAEATATAGGSVATDTIFDAKGDLPVGTGANTAAKLTAGADGLVLTTDSTTATGLKWAAGGGTPTAITVQDTTDTSCNVALFESATGDLGPKTDAGLTYDASSGALTISALTQGSILFAGAGGVITQSNANLFYDAGNARLGVGIALPLSPIHLGISQNAATTLRVSNGTSGTAAQADFRAYNSSGDFFSVGIYSATTSTYGAITARSAFNYVASPGGIALMADNVSGNIRFATGGSSEKMRLESNGRLGIGVPSPTTILSLPSDTASTGGIAFGTDVTLYRSSANNLSLTGTISTRVNQNAATSITVTNALSGTLAQADFRAVNSSGDFFSVGIYSATTSTYGPITARSAFNYTASPSGIALMADNAAGSVRFSSGGSSEKMRLDTNGRLGIGVTGPTAMLSLPSDTTAAFGIAFGTDVNLYRSAADVLKTDDSLSVGANLTLAGGVIKKWVQKSAIYTITTADYGVEATANTFTVTLPTAVGITGQEFVVKNSGSGVITLDGDGSETIDGSTTQTLNQYDSYAVVSNGSNWEITSKVGSSGSGLTQPQVMARGMGI